MEGSDHVLNLLYSLDICLEGLRNVTKTLSQESLCPGGYSNIPRLEYKPEVFPLELTCQHFYSAHAHLYVNISLCIISKCISLGLVCA
jgi:hypothetical protein